MKQKRAALITGVAGGIGSTTARLFIDSGWYVVGVNRRQFAGVSGKELDAELGVALRR